MVRQLLVALGAIDLPRATSLALHSWSHSNGRPSCWSHVLDRRERMSWRGLKSEATSAPASLRMKSLDGVEQSVRTVANDINHWQLHLVFKLLSQAMGVFR